MRLISAQIRGIGRLEDTLIKLDQKVIAIVGPNEAGKTTLLDALAFVEETEGLPVTRRSRNSKISNHTPVVSLRYRVEDEDLERLDDFELEESPKEFFVERRAGGQGPFFRTKPELRKSEAIPLAVGVKLLEELQEVSYLEPLSVEAGETDPRLPDGDSLLEELRQFSHDFRNYFESPADERTSIDDLRCRADEIAVVLQKFSSSEPILGLLRQFCEWMDQALPKRNIEEQLWSRTPDMVLFTEADRRLSSSYTLNEKLLKSVPPALDNLARLADLDLAELVESVDHVARRDTLKNKANKKLAEHFSKVWKQSDLQVQINIESNLLRIGLLEDGVNASEFGQRSAGLRMFVALAAFLAARDTGRPTVLLVDEAETHLHINAQADLVQMFAEQEKADKIIYTTHSPACLPADLGVGIRAVTPGENETSIVQNSFWREEGGGFTSLMFAMGASAAAFTPARCAVIAEGATDMILLPSLMRTANNVESLPYQVAPGLSEMPKDSYSELDFQAAKVVFLVDGDNGGEELAKSVGRAIPPERIVKLDAPGIENTLDSNFYLESFITLLKEINDSSKVEAPPVLDESPIIPWATTLENWAIERGLRAPSKQDMANYLIDLDQIELSSSGAYALRHAHAELLQALNMGS